MAVHQASGPTSYQVLKAVSSNQPSIRDFAPPTFSGSSPIVVTGEFVTDSAVAVNCEKRSELRRPMSIPTFPEVPRERCMTTPSYAFFQRLARVYNSGQSRCVILHGNIYDLFWDGSEYVPLIHFVQEKTAVAGLIRLVYELNGPIRVGAADYDRLRDAWVSWKTGMDAETLNLRDLKRRENVLQQRRDEYDSLIRGSIGNATQASNSFVS